MKKCSKCSNSLNAQWRKMKKYFISVLLILSTILPFFCAAQDKLIKLSPKIRDTIDLIERDYYYLYPSITDFQYAMIYLNSDTTTITKIICWNNEGLIKDTLINNSADYVGNLKTYIRQINLDRLENYETDDIITVTKLDGNQLVGKLLAVQDSSFIICPDTISEVGTPTFLKSYKKLNANEVERIYFEFDFRSRFRDEAGYGALIGIIPGVIIAVNSVDGGFYSMSEDVVKVWAGIAGAGYGALAGGLIGMIVGLITSSADETIEINSASDLERLKGYVVQ